VKSSKYHSVYLHVTQVTVFQIIHPFWYHWPYSFLLKHCLQCMIETEKFSFLPTLLRSTLVHSMMTLAADVTVQLFSLGETWGRKMSYCCYLWWESRDSLDYKKLHPNECISLQLQSIKKRGFLCFNKMLSLCCHSHSIATKIRMLAEYIQKQNKSENKRVFWVLQYIIKLRYVRLKSCSSQSFSTWTPGTDNKKRYPSCEISEVTDLSKVGLHSTHMST